MRHTSKKRAALDRKWAPVRLEYWQREFPECMACGAPSQCTHEIASGMSARSASKYDPAAWLSACSDCNQYCFTDHEAYPIERQLALKWIFDVERFDLERVNVLRGRDPGAITMLDLRPHIIYELTSGRLSGRAFE